MQRILSLGLLIIIFMGILYACNLGGGAPATEQAAFSGEMTALSLAVQAQSGPFTTVGQTIVFQYTVTNSGSTPLAGPVTVTDTKAAVSCPAVNTVGDLNDSLDPFESLSCASSYVITQDDLNAGSVTSTAGATAGGVNSNVVTTVVQMTLARVLELTATVNPTTYNNSNQTINFSFTVRNTGGTTLGPAQFIIKDTRLGTVNCGAADTILLAGASFSCTHTFTTAEADRTATQLTFSLEAVGGGAITNQPVSVTVTNTAVTGGGSSSNYTPGTTITHDVVKGEWMLQIARCYGADFKALALANPQVKDPAKIWPIDKLTVPNIGSNGRIYGPPCIEYITAQSGDTWESIASKYNARVDVLKEANQGVSTVTSGARIRVPLNSAGGNWTPSPPTTEPIRLNITPGGASVTNSGILSAVKQRERYVFTASQGQSLTATLTAPSGGLELAVLFSNGTALKAQNATLTWTGTLPSNGDYYVDVVNVTNSDRQFSLELALALAPSPAERVADINPGTADSNPSHLAVFNNALYFSAASNDGLGVELWKYDAATNTPSRVKDIFPGAEGSNPAFLAEYNGALYFSANGNDGAGIELWRFNGADAGRLTDINPNGGNANPSYMTVFNGFLYFSATDGVSGTEIWRTDGVNTTRMTDIYFGGGDANPAYLEVYNSALYFSAVSNDGFGVELWKYDGTNAPVRVTDINAGVGNANPAYLAVLNNILYFSANDGTGTELWRYDGTTASRAADIFVGGDSIPSHLTVFNGELYFSANNGGAEGYELWKFNGTAAALAADINKTGDSAPAYLVVYNNQLYFGANGGDNTGRELWRFRLP